MTGIPSVPPAPSTLPTSAHKMRAMSDGADFHAHMQAQCGDVVRPPDRTRAEVDFDNVAACSYRREDSDICAEVFGKGGLNAFAIAVALSPITVTWVPTEIVRAPLRTPGMRIFRRRKSEAAQSQLFDRSVSEEGG